MLTFTKEIKAIRINTGRLRRRVVWQSRYDGCVAVAYIRGRAIAGISGPWSDKYALTCWQKAASECQLELFDSLEAAKREVEDRAQHADRLGNLFCSLRRGSALVARALLPQRNHERSSRPSLHETVIQLRQMRQWEDIDISRMHFHAFE